MRTGKPAESGEVASTSAPPAKPRPVSAEPAAVLPQPGDLARADELLRGGWYDAALAIYRPLSASAVPALRQTLIYRMALCWEGLSRWDEALAAFRQTASRGDAPRAAAAGQLGQGRVYVRMRRLTEAKQLLYDLLLRSAQPALRDQPLLVEAQYLLALALAFETQVKEADPLRSSPVSHAGADWPLDEALDWVAPGKASVAGEPDPGLDELSVQPSGVSLREALVRVTVHNSGVPELLERLANESGFRIHWTPRARELASDRTTTVILDAVPVSELWRMQTDPLGLVWKAADGIVTCSAEEELTRQELTAHRRAQARHALRDALVTHPNHPMATTAYLEVGNLEVADGNVKEAMSWYRRLIQEHPRSRVAVEVHYNLALVHHRQGDFSAARRLFFGVVDRAPGHELAPLAYLRIGHLYLEANQPEYASSPLRRARTLAAGSPAQPVAVLALAVSYLLQDNPQAAAAIIFENRERLKAEAYRPFASFLEAYAHYRAIPDRRRAQREASTALAALLGIQDRAALVPGGELLVGRAYRELGLSERMAAVYEKALTTARGPLAGEMTCALADYLNSVGRRADARRWLLPWAEADQGLWTQQARLRMAEIGLMEKRPDDSLAWCRKLLGKSTGVDVPATLKVMGQAFELAGEHRQAARCFAGMLPD